MRIVRIVLCVLAQVCVLVLLAGCVGSDISSNNDTLDSAASLGNIPLPQPERTASYSEDDLSKPGHAYAVALPSKNVTVSGMLLQFDPAASPSTGLAYAMYDFTLDGYDRDETVCLDWQQSGDSNDAWIGLSDWGANCWHWYQLPADNWIEADFSSAIHAATGSMLVLVVCVGHDLWTLNEVHVGENITPVISGVEPLTGTTGSDTAFAVTCSGVPPLDYSWNFGGGATPNLSSDGTPLVTLGSSGVYEATVTVSNGAGSDTFEYTLTVVDPTPGWVHTWGTTNHEEAKGIAVDAAGNVYTTSWRNVYDNTQNGIFTVKYNADGTVGWVQSYSAGVDGDAGEWMDGAAVAVDDNYNVYVTGTWRGPVENPAVSILLLRYDSSGALDWQITWDGSSNDSGADLALDAEGNVYIAGSTWSYGPESPTGFPRNVVLIKFDDAGTYQWARVWGGDEVDDARAVALGDNGEIYVLAKAQLASPAIALLTYADDGSLLADELWSSGNEDPAEMAVSNGNIYITGTHNNAEVLFVRYRPSADTWDWAQSWTGYYAFGGGIEYDPVGRVLITGNFSDGIIKRLVLLDVDDTGALAHQKLWTAAADLKYAIGTGIALGDHGMIHISGGASHIGGAWQDAAGTMTALNAVIVTNTPTLLQVNDAVVQTMSGIEGTPVGVLDEGAGGLGPDFLVMKLNAWEIGID
ncbi:SBBP repeat-containing protein [bacterium]|nr:SBBP repeat-containing protein [bacterium]